MLIPLKSLNGAANSKTPQNTEYLALRNKITKLHFDHFFYSSQSDICFNVHQGNLYHRTTNLNTI